MNYSKKYSLKGNVMVATMVTLAIAGLALMISKSIADNRKLERFNRVKSGMAEIHKSIRRALLSRSSYTYPCAAVVRPANCTAEINTNLKILGGGDGTFPFLGAVCDTGTPNCGFQVRVTSPYVVGPTNTVRVDVIYQGKEIKLNYVDTPGAEANRYNVIMDVPQSVFTGSTTCPTSAPIYEGTNPGTGAPICQSIPSCTPGQYLQNTVSSSGAVSFTCKALPSAPTPPAVWPVQCADQSKFAKRINFNTTTDGSLSFTCIDRIASPIFPVDCQMSGWSHCSTACGPGTQSRSVVQQPANGGAACPDPALQPLEYDRPCNEAAADACDPGSSYCCEYFLGSCIAPAFPCYANSFGINRCNCP